MLLDFPPDEGIKGSGLNTWSFSHARDHDEIVKAIQDQYGIILPIYPLDPMVFSNDSMFLLRNQQMHNDLLSLLGIAGTDISAINFDDQSQVQAWLSTHFEEHRNARVALGI